MSNSIPGFISSLSSEISISSGLSGRRFPV